MVSTSLNHATADQLLRAVDGIPERLSGQLAVFLTGASGSGKSFVAKTLIPVTSEKITYCAYDQWQWNNVGTNVEQSLPITRDWIAKEVQTISGKLAICDSLHQPDMSRQAALLEGIAHPIVIHLTCDAPVRLDRLLRLRSQPELATQGTLDWAEMLDDKAREMGIPIINTGQPTEQVTSAIRAIIINGILKASRQAG